MRVLLIRPPVPRHTIGLKHIMICEPLELEYVAAGLAGHDVEIFDMILETGLKERLRRFRPNVVGTSCYITGVNEVKKICRFVKLWNRDCVTVAGGVQATLVPEDFADKAIDCIVLGDGTTVMPEIVNAIQNEIPFENIPGLALPCGPDKVYFTALREYMPKPDTLPLPRRDLIAHLQKKYYYLFHQPVVTMKTTWGCWYRCNFCYTWKITDGVPYSRSPESIVNELETIEAKDVYIVDDIFLINPGRLAKLAQLIRERGIRKRYLVYGRADFMSAHEDVIKEWAELGLSAVFIGLEAVTNPELNSLNKECTVDCNYSAIEILRRHGVDTYGSLIPNPDYAPEDWERLWTFVQKTGLYYLNVSPMTPFPGTDIWKDYKDNLIISRKAHGMWDLSHCVLPTRMPLKDFYRSLLMLYAKTILDISRAKRLMLRTRPPVWSRKFLRLWLGALRITWQFIRAPYHHNARNIATAEYEGPEVPGLEWKERGKQINEEAYINRKSKEVQNA